MLDTIPHFFGLSHKTLAEVVVTGAIVIYLLTYWVIQVVKARSLASKKDCPQCHSNDVSPSKGKRIWDWPFRLMRCVPYRCQVCSTRYFCADNGSSAAQPG